MTDDDHASEASETPGGVVGDGTGTAGAANTAGAADDGANGPSDDTEETPATETFPGDYARATVSALPDAPNPTRGKREVDEAVGASQFGCNLFVADPGEQLPWGYHHHPDHEELFYVLAGELRVETDNGDRRVTAGQVFFVPAGAGNRARAVGDRRARVLAVGAPKASDGAVISEPCPACGAETDRTADRDGDAYVLSCADCGTETDRFGAGPEA